jgi:hypothetical protein
MDLTTPAQIDTRLAAIYWEEAKVRAERDQALANLRRIVAAQGTYEAAYYWNSPEKQAEAERVINAADAEITRLGNEAEPLEAQYAARRWTRYYLVTNSNGHVHSSTSCDTCFPTTQYAWLTEQSGMTAEALVDLAGESACTVCFPWAPVAVLARPSVLEAPERKAAREEREAKRAARDAKKVEKALFTDEPDRVIKIDVHYLGTVAAARSWLTDAAQWKGWYEADGREGGHPSYPPEGVAQVAQAVAAKEGKTTETVLDEAAKRAAKRK